MGKSGCPERLAARLLCCGMLGQESVGAIRRLRKGMERRVSTPSFPSEALLALLFLRTVSAILAHANAYFETSQAETHGRFGSAILS